MILQTATKRKPAESNLQRRRDVVVHELDGEALVYDPITSDTHQLNQTAYRIWQACDGSRSPSAIARELTDVYAISFASALSHVERIMSEFQALRLIPTRGLEA